MAGIYFHIPFCKQACHYCNFHFSTSTHLRKEMIEAIHKEIRLLNEKENKVTNLNNEIIETIYFGGGTPSILEVEEIKNLIKAVYKNYTTADAIEITLEANPDDITFEKLSGWKDAGINRLSLGIQSLDDDELKWMNRAHNAEQALQSIQLIKESGIHNFSIDLIYGSPISKNKSWKAEMEKIIDLDAPHVACYALTVETGTALQKMISLKKKENVSNELQGEQFEFLMGLMENKGYDHYEISNFSKPGFRSKHNSSYWKGIHYLGIGPSAHSFDGEKRRWNISNNQLYITSINNNLLPFEEEILSEKDKYNEKIMISLRTSEGLVLNEIEKLFGKEMRQQLESGSKKYIDEGKAVLINEKLILTKAGKLFADAIASDLFLN